MIVVVVISAVAIICCCCTKRHKGLVYRQTPKSASNGLGQDGGPVEPSGEFITITHLCNILQFFMAVKMIFFR